MKNVERKNGGMIRLLIRVFISPLAIIALHLLILVPLVLAIVDVVPSLKPGADLHEQITIVEGMGVILIGWGVALEERGALREIFKLGGRPDEARQVAIDHACHAAGIGLLIFGLFSEIGIEMIQMPRHIVDTSGFDEFVLGLSVVFLAICIWIVVRHLFVLVTALAGKVPAPAKAGH